MSTPSNPDHIKFNRKQLFATRFPNMSVTLLNQTDITLPNDLQGKPSIIYLAGPSSSQAELDSWSAPLRTLFSNNVNHLECCFTNQQQPLDTYIDQLKPLVSPEFHSIIGLSHQPFEHFKKSLLLYSEKFVFVFVLDAQGHIIFSQPGPCTEFQLFRVKRTLKNALEADINVLKADASHLKSKRKAIIFGATGLVGSCVLQELLTDKQYSQVHIAVRKPTSYVHPKLIEHVIQFEDLAAAQHLFKVDDVFCCLGTTLKEAKSKDNQKKIDLNYCKSIASYSNQHNCSTFLLVSSVGASSTSSSFYLALKGQLEDYVTNCHIKHCYVFRPSVLLGFRKTFRLGEYLSKLVLFLLFPFLVGPLSKYKPISAKVLAKAMVYVAKNDHPNAIFTFNHIKKLASR